MSSSSRPSTTPAAFFASAVGNTSERMDKLIDKAAHVSLDKITDVPMDRLVLALSRSIHPEHREKIWEKLHNDIHLIREQEYEVFNVAPLFATAFKHLENAQYFATADERKATCTFLIAEVTKHNNYALGALKAYIKNTIDDGERREIFNNLVELFKKNLTARVPMLQILFLPLVDTLVSEDLEYLLPIIRLSVVGEFENVLEHAEEFLLKIQQRHLVSPETLAKHHLPSIQPDEKHRPVTGDFKLEISAALDSKYIVSTRKTACRRLEDDLNENNANLLIGNVLVHISEHMTGIDKTHLGLLFAAGFKWLEARQQAAIQRTLLPLLKEERSLAHTPMLDTVKAILTQMGEEQQIHFLNRIIAMFNPNILISSSSVDHTFLGYSATRGDKIIVDILTHCQVHRALEARWAPVYAFTMQHRLDQGDIAMPPNLSDIAFRYVFNS